MFNCGGGGGEEEIYRTIPSHTNDCPSKGISRKILKFVPLKVGNSVFLMYIHQHRFIVRFLIRVGPPLHNTPFPGVLMKSMGAAILRPDALPGVNHMRGMQYQIVLDII